MGKDSANNTLNRQWHLLQLLDSNDWRKSSDLLERLRNIDSSFDVTLRTIQRDLNNLALVFEIESEPGTANNNLWRWKKNAKLELNQISEAEAMMLLMVDDYLKPLLPSMFLNALKPQMDHARRKLKFVGRSAGAGRIRDKTRIVHPTLNMLPPKISQITMEQLKNSLIKNIQLKIKYQSLNTGEEKSYRVHPLGLVLRGPSTYLVATANDHQNPILFAVHRIKTAEYLTEQVSTPIGFDLDDYINKGALNFGDATGTTLPLKLRIAPKSRLANILAESPLSKDQKLSEKNGCTYVEASVPDTWQLKWWLMQHANEVAVEKPASLKKEIIKRLKEALKQYE